MYIFLFNEFNKNLSLLLVYICCTYNIHYILVETVLNLNTLIHEYFFHCISIYKCVFMCMWTCISFYFRPNTKTIQTCRENYTCRVFNDRLYIVAVIYYSCAKTHPHNGLPSVWVNSVPCQLCKWFHPYDWKIACYENTHRKMASD